MVTEQMEVRRDTSFIENTPAMLDGECEETYRNTHP